MAVSLPSEVAVLSSSASAFSLVFSVICRVFSSMDAFVSFTKDSYAFCASVSALIASASSFSVSRMICSIMPMTPPDPDDCLYSLNPGGGRPLTRLRVELDELLVEDLLEHVEGLGEELLRGA